LPAAAREARSARRPDEPGGAAVARVRGTFGALRVLGGTIPTFAGCGAGATITGNNTLGTVVVGTTPGTCVVTFSGTWTNVPKCMVNNRTVANRAAATGNTTTTFTIGGTIASTNIVDNECKSS
jgi:hypothetical protein